MEGGGVLHVTGVAEPAQPFLVAWLHLCFPETTLVVVTPEPRRQELFQQDLETWLRVLRGLPEPGPGAKEAGGAAAAASVGNLSLYFPAWEVLPGEERLPHVDTISERLETLVQLASAPHPEERVRVVVTCATALLQRTFAPGELRRRLRSLQRGDRVDPLALVEWLEAQGYEPEVQVTQKGELALRGGIVDVFPPTEPWPVRLEFFGDTLESLRSFDPSTQVSRETRDSVTLGPAGELGLLRRGWQSAAAGTETAPEMSSLLEHLPRHALLVVCEPEEVKARATEYSGQIRESDPFFQTWESVERLCLERGLPRLLLSEVAEEHAAVQGAGPFAGRAADGDTREAAALDLHLQSLEAFRPLPERPPPAEVAEAQRRAFFQQMHRWLRQGHAVVVFCTTPGEQKRFEELWEDLLPPGEEARGRRPEVRLGTLSRGFWCEPAACVVVSDAEVFGRTRIPRPRRLKSRHAAAMRSVFEIDFADWEVGDLVVHLNHGIGRYLGLATLPGGGAGGESGMECLVIEYAPREPGESPPRLYVPVSEAHLVSKYVGAGRVRPPLHTLGGHRWRVARERAERAVRDVAAELLAVAAARAAQPGHAFGPDTPWQREFEAAFPFEETPDQLRTIAEVKADMEKPRPMDRLVCGDVGFGKTEVALRAAFKAVMDGKQVAVLVPTTVLAQQHYNTFRDRMVDSPVRVELLSRFRTRREQRQVIEGLAIGAVDIVIGTHRLLQDDVQFKDLGLVVVDEEQRFGVLHKERLKQLRTQVDVLTLSATPIPRTLYLALTGARDLSLIQTPPQDRLPVETIVVPYDEEVIRQAILRELNRGGQVYFLHNRVMTIETMRARLQALVPEARIVVGHGQMRADDLEEVMTRFVNGEADILLSTTIIESGLDIPNANTIIIDRADRFGLSDLYQLRGRVGRYKHQAYAYLLLPRHARLLTDVRKRLSAMRQYASLGSGFKVAMRDLEIRGAGNLLGPEQSGHITAVGFELYCQLLQQSIAALQGRPLPKRVDVSLRLDFLEVAAGAGGDGTGLAVACLPHRYVPQPRHRIEMYRRLAQVTDEAGLRALEAEMRDRFGPLPEPVQWLLMTVRIKLAAAARGITAVEVRDDRLMLSRNGEWLQWGGRFPRLMRRAPGARLKEILRFLAALPVVPEESAAQQQRS
ncbi:transcription-repair coupling factor [Limisphaera sp. VF-2]|jgi:transcription-repair coupling factor (superfamily II helicase)|uniref:transcription-repair coupling factor n=1 Tax=Limisphaera sp. VF-2 TaxID=3400418 RepID=UPI0017627765